jgi:urea transport system permease protein
VPGRRFGRALAGAFALVLACGLALLAGAPARALGVEEAHRIAAGDTEQRLEALAAVAARGNPALAGFVQALLADEVRVAAGRALIVREGRVTVAGSGEALAALPEGAEAAVVNNRLRRAAGAALAAVSLFSPERSERARAVAALKDSADASTLPLVERALAQEGDAGLRVQLALLRSAIAIDAEDPVRRAAAARELAAGDQPSIRALLLERLAVEGEPAVKAALAASLAQVERRLAWGERLGVLFAGVSLGSILLLVALGLAITYGLMGVINMAHGELMMIGAYATWAVQNAFRAWWPAGFDAYVLAAVPASFLAAAAVGAVLERGVIRFLYGRPLETLLATWGISLILMQTVRSLFGAQNVAVENPAWLSGGWQVLPNLVLPWNRIVILGFAAAVLAATALLIARTRLGLFVRGVTQNRRMAACTGVDTARVDTLAFALGAGIAGLAGCALSQVGNVGPDLGQGYIVDAFMVVVLGGVGQLAGTVVAGLGLGVVNKLLEGVAGAVLAKIVVLVLIVVFIQKRPQGLFAMKGRSAEA